MAIVVPIAADYDGSGVKAAQESFANFGQSLSKSLQQAGRDARKAFKDVEDGAQNSTTAAQRLATAISKSADVLDADLKASKAAADALAKALGPDFSAKLGQGGLNKLVLDLNRAGVSIREITNEADTLAVAIKKVDGVNLQNVTTETNNLNTGVAAVNTQVTAGRQVFSSFSGQAATELANVGGSLGAVASGMGQVVAQSVAGRVSLLDFAKTAGPMLAVSVVLLQIKSVFEDIKAAKAWRKEEVESFTDALRDGSNVSMAVRDRIDEVGGAFVQVNKKVHALSPNGLVRTIFGFSLPVAKEVKDITADLTALGLKASGVAKLVAGGQPSIDQYTSALTAAGVSSERVAVVSDYLTQQLDLTADAQKAAAIATEFGVGATRAQATAMDTTAIAAGAAAVATEQKAAADLAAKEAADAAALADQNHANAIDAVREALYKRNNARYASQDADANAKKALEEYAKAQEQANKTGSSKDAQKAAELQAAAERALNQAAAAASNLAGETRNYASETEKSNAQNDAAAGKLNELKGLLGKGGALSATVEQWILLLDRVPKDIVTRFGISFGSSVTTATPSTSSASSIADTWASNGMFSNSGGVTNVTNITVNGATNSQETADLIQQNQNRSNQRQGIPQ